MADVKVCKRQIMGEQGGATEFLVRLPDGYLLSCGWNEGRADDVAAALRKSYEPTSQMKADEIKF